MSCSTAYLVRDLDGVWRVRWQKRGPWCIADADTRDEVLARTRAEGIPLARLLGRPWPEGFMCQGVLLDMLERRLRFYACSGTALFFESTERMVARASVWAGWDVAYLWGGRLEFAELVPDAAPLEHPMHVRPLEELSRALLPWEESLVSWDRENLRLRRRYDWWTNYDALLSVIDERLVVLDYGFSNFHAFEAPAVLPWLAHGERLLDVLASAAPHPLPLESEVDDGVIIDCPARRIRYWSGLPVVPALLAAVRAAWPGWSIERLPHGFAGHLAATDRQLPDTLIPEAELSDFDPDWLRERASLPLDARGLRCI